MSPGQAAKSQGMKIHLGLLLTQEGFRPWLGKNGTAKGWALQQNAVAGRLHELYARDYADTIVGIYTEIEESNSASWINIFPTFATDYLQTISKAAKSLPKWRQLKVWSSPYSVGNTTRHPPPGYVSPRDYGDAWSSIFSKAPDFDLVAPQDSMGAQGNSFLNSSQYLGNISNAARANGRKETWSNVELFETWPPSCRWSKQKACPGRHPAPFERIKAQMQNEARVLGGGGAAILIAWEWYSCFTPNAADDPLHHFSNETAANYRAYVSYLQENMMPSAKKLKGLLRGIADWTMGLNLASNNISGAKDRLSTSIFINGNLARVLLSSYRIFGEQRYLQEGLSWCDTFVGLQKDAITHDGERKAGWWDTGYNELYIADTGTAVTALGLCHKLSPQSKYIDAMRLFAEFVQNGSETTPKCTFTPGCSYDGGKGETSSGFIISMGEDQGAVGDGYYMQEINETPYTISTATAGGAFFAELWMLSKHATTNANNLESIAIGSTKWLLKKVQPNGSIPYIISPPTNQNHSYQSISYSAEAFIDCTLRFGVCEDGMISTLSSTVDFLLRFQQDTGDLVGSNASMGERQRSPRAISLLQWHFSHSPNKSVSEAIGKFFDYLYSEAGSDSYGLNQYALSTGFIGLAAADLIEPWITFV